MSGKTELEGHFEIIQICHGKIIPDYSSAYALKVRHYLEKFASRKIFSVAGLIFKDQEEREARQFHSFLMTGMAYLKGNRSLEILLSKGSYLRRRYFKEVKGNME